MGSTIHQMYTLPLRVVHSYLQRSGISASELLVGTELTEAELEEPYNIISPTQARTYYLNAVTHGEIGIGLEIGFDTCLADMGPQGLKELSSVTLRDAIDTALASSALYYMMGNWRVKIYEKVMVYHVIVDEHVDALSIFLVERGIGTLHSHMEELCGPEAKPTRVHLSYPRPENYRRYEDIFHCPVLFDQPGNELHYPAHYLDCKIKTADPLVHPTMASMATDLQAKILSRGEIAREVAQYLHRQKGRLPNIEEGAQHFATTSRTLRRKLAAKGTSYQKLLDAERRRAAEYLLLNTKASIKEISGRMGYTRAQNFSLAFKHWTGATPSEYRMLNSNSIAQARKAET